MIAKELLQKAIAENKEGFTLPLKWKVKRYVVAFTNNNKNPSFSLLKKQAESFKAIESLTIGGWTSDSGESFIDIGTTTNSKAKALELWRLFNQQAIFDLKTYNTIYV